MGALQPWHIIVILVVLVLLFGSKRLPDASRSLGRAMRIFKAETKGMVHEDEQSGASAGSPSATQQQQQQQLPQGGDGTTVNGVPLTDTQQPTSPNDANTR